jgi:hypothetical protein
MNWKAYADRQARRGGHEATRNTDRERHADNLMTHAAERRSRSI